MRLIDADKFILALMDASLSSVDEDTILDLVDSVPTVDAVIVTRCKDCEHYRNHPNGLCYLHTEPKENARGYAGDAVCVEPDDFCSYGERREGT